jgi:HPt (histidine-containing phosphotransfer) domain-containing protein
MWIDYAQGLARFSGMDALYRKYLLKFPDDPTFLQMQTAMEQKDYEQAFCCAHTLKGITGNLSLTALHDAVEDFVEKLRDGRDLPGALAAWEPLREVYQNTQNAIRTQP